MRRRAIQKARGLAILFRPWYLLPSVFSLVVGVLLAVRETSSTVGVGALVGGMLVVGPLTAGGCIVFNQVVDYPKDSRSPMKRKLALVRMYVGIRTAYVAVFVLLAAGLALSCVLGRVVFIGTVAATALGLAYSHPAVRLKEQPPLGCVAGGVSYAIVPVIVGWALVSTVPWSALAMGLPLLVIYTSGYVLLGLPELDSSPVGGARVLPFVLGHKRTVEASIVLVGLSGLITSLLVLLGWYPAASLVVLPVIVSIMAMHYRLLERRNMEMAFVELRYLYLVLGLIFIVTLAM